MTGGVPVTLLRQRNDAMVEGNSGGGEDTPAHHQHSDLTGLLEEVLQTGCFHCLAFKKFTKGQDRTLIIGSDCYEEQEENSRSQREM